MTENNNLIYIIGGPLLIFILCLWILRSYRNMNREKNEKIRIKHLIKKLIITRKIKPVLQITDEEIKDEYEQHDNRIPEIVGEENI